MNVFPETLVSVEGTNGSMVPGAGYQIIKRSGEKVRQYIEPSIADKGEKPWHVVR